MSAPPNADNTVATEEMLDIPNGGLSPPISSAKSHHVDLVSASPASLTASMMPLLYERLCAVALLLLIVYTLVLAWTLVEEGFGAISTTYLYCEEGIVRLLLLGAILAVLKWNTSRTAFFLRGVEYFLFGSLALLWMFTRYESFCVGAAAGDLAELRLDERTTLFGLFMLIVVHGVFIPNRWYHTARVVSTMALAPVVALVLFEWLQPELAQAMAPMLTWDFVGTNVLIVVVGCVLACYASHVLQTLREEVYEAQEYGQYRLVRKLGSGAMGDVYLAEHVLLKRPSALKLIRRESATDPHALARFEREVKATSSLTHPNTIQVFDYGHTEEGTFYYVMEFLPGMGLDELLLRHGPLPAGRVIYLLRQACSALAEAHSAGLIHRDLKPGNLYITERGGQCDFVKLLDFGLVKQTQESKDPQLTGDHTVSGTPLYMAPEQAMANPLDARSDLYSLGAVGYHMLVGTAPFSKNNAMAVMMAHVQDPAPNISEVNPDVPTDLAEVIQRCLEKSPDARYATAIELDRALASCASSEDWSANQAAIWWRELCVGSTNSRV